MPTRLLIVTQAVDTEDPVLGFFVRWIEEFAKHTEHIEVICLKEGKHALPTNVRVHSLGKENGAVSRATYAWRFLRLAWKLRNEYDTVFVHMNEEYVLLGGLLWRLGGKRVVLWRNHKRGSWRTSIAIALSNVVCHTSPQAFVASSTKAVLMPIGIDTDMFIPPISLPPQNTILFLGRLDPVKRPDLFIEALTILSDRGIDFRAHLYGSPTDPDAPYVQEYMALATPLVTRGVMVLSEGVSHSETPEIYQAHSVYVNLTPSGSFDKTIGEAMASGCVVVSSNAVLRGTIHPELMVSDDDVQDVARGICVALGLSEEERAMEVQKLRAYINEHHGLERLMTDIRDSLKGK